MPLPAILGLPALMTFLGSMFGSALTWIIQKFTYKVVTFTLAMTSILLALQALYSEFSGYIGQLSLSMPSEMAQAAMFLPSNTNACIGIILSAQIASLVYRFVLYIVKTKMDLAS